MFELDTDVIVVGNGPAGIALSTFLSGWHPIYTAPKSCHNDTTMEECLPDSSSLLLDPSIAEWYAEEWTQRQSSNVGLYSDLYDRLMRPDVAEGLKKTSRLQYEYMPALQVRHVVLGDSQVGGSWNQYDDNMETVSLSNWMDLPVYSLSDWMGGQPLLARLPAGIIREYMHEYVKHLNLQKNFREFTMVTNITKLCCDLTHTVYWRVQGQSADGLPFELTCRRIVLACGRKRHRTLEVDGELNAQNIVYNQRAMRQLFQQQADLDKARLEVRNEGKDKRPVLVVGDGISAADAITYCLKEGIPVRHVFRRTERQLKGTMLSRLSEKVYPEYSTIFDLMLERTEHPCYQRSASTSVLAIHPDSTALLRYSNGEAKEELVDYRCLVICVGLQTELSMLEDKHDFDANYQSRQDPSLFAIGSVVGDHFIRYLIGGAFRVAQLLLQQQLYDDYCLVKLKQATFNSPLPSNCSFDYNCHAEQLNSPHGSVESHLAATTQIDSNNNEEVSGVQEQHIPQSRCFIPRLFCRLLSVYLAVLVNLLI